MNQPHWMVCLECETARPLAWECEACGATNGPTEQRCHRYGCTGTWSIGSGIHTPAQLQHHLAQARVHREKAHGEGGGKCGGKGVGKGGKGRDWPGIGSGSAGSTSAHAEPPRLYEPTPAQALSAIEGPAAPDHAAGGQWSGDSTANPWAGGAGESWSAMRVTIVDPEADAAANPAPPTPVDKGLSVIAPVTIIAVAHGSPAPFIQRVRVSEGEGAFLKPITGGSIGLRRNAVGDLFMRVRLTT